MRRLSDPVANGFVGVAGVAKRLVEDEVRAALDEDGIGAAHGENIDLVLPALIAPVWCGVAVNIFVQCVAPRIERGLFEGLRCGQDKIQQRRAGARSWIPAGAQRTSDTSSRRRGGWVGGCLDMDVAAGAGDAEVVLAVGPGRRVPVETEEQGAA